ncbi:MAG: hypothetical protein ACC619_10215 [Paracoccaceae bacterium]
MDKFLRLFVHIRILFVQVTQTGFAIVAFIVLLYLLLGEDAGPYVISVITNLVLLVGAITPQALVGIAIAGALLYAVSNRS